MSGDDKTGGPETGEQATGADDQTSGSQSVTEAEQAAGVESEVAGATPPVSDSTEPMKDVVGALNEKKDALLASDQLNQATQAAGGLWAGILDSGFVGAISASFIGRIFYGFGPIKSFSNGRYPENEGRAKGVASIIGVYALAIIVCIPLFILMPKPTVSETKTNQAAASTKTKKKKKKKRKKKKVNIKKLASCYKRKNVINMRGCRGGENQMQCARRQCGRYNKEAYNKAL